MTAPKKDEKKQSRENKQNPEKDIETVVSKNDNVEPVPDKKQLEEKKKGHK